MKRENMRICEVTQIYRDQLKVSQDKFAADVAEKLSNVKISRQSVSNWENGKDHPTTDLLLVCAVVYKDWRRAWALDCLKVKLPEVFDSGVVKFNGVA